MCDEQRRSGAPRIFQGLRQGSCLPWFAPWDWAFLRTTLAHIDLEDAKRQLILLCQSWYMHPNR
ncbi:hypothetical protein RSO01_47640 [Reyranella soli]|uniref:Uncharacterized protein n=1 Tax=Reyranella soli TaxID=1230389 RepID=A0A512NF80_9HYPH|nr:hypothetical protein RSO01_47640 [Reyranella soli]